jgi:hypothetical protein
LSIPSLDWTQPWLQPYAALGQRLAHGVAQGEPVHGALNRLASAGQPRFVPQSALPPGQAYESFVQQHGQCPMRDNLHDLLNGLIWLHFPRSKARLSALHATELAWRGASAPRGPLRDALTLFDENGALLLAPRPMWDALRARDWRGLFVTRRDAWRGARLLVFGHGLLEQLQTPRKPITAHVLWAPDALNTIASIDRWLADAVTASDWQHKPFAPLPVLGVPGWCGGNGDDSFYDDPLVFRSAGRSERLHQRTASDAA